MSYLSRNPPEKVVPGLQLLQQLKATEREVVLRCEGVLSMVNQTIDNFKKEVETVLQLFDDFSFATSISEREFRELEKRIVMKKEMKALAEK